MTRSGIKITPTAGHSGIHLRQYLADVFLYFTGVFGLLFYIHALDMFQYDSRVVCLVTAFVSAGIWVMYNHAPKGRRLIFPVAIFSIILVAVVNAETLRRQLSFMVSVFLGGAARDGQSCTLSAALIMVIASQVLFLLCCVLRRSGLLLFVGGLLLAASPFVGMHVPTAAAIILAVYLSVFTAARTASPTPRSVWLNSKKQASPTLALAAFTGTVTLICLIISLLFTVRNPQMLFNSVYAVEGFFHRTNAELSYTVSDPIQGGNVANKNHYPTGARHLEIWTTSRPTDILYLRGFAGGSYENGCWSPAQDGLLLDNIESANPGNPINAPISYMLADMYVRMNGYMQPKGEGFRTLSIRHTSNAFDTRYEPYWGCTGAISLSSGTEGYGYFYYQKRDMMINPDNIIPGYTDYMAQFLWLQEAYMSEAQKAYTAVPKEHLPRLAALCAENPLTEIDEITEYIIDTLHDSCIYTKTPGMSPVNRDIAEDFLFERQRGYCVHFATAATLMYRLYGVPARYVAGYIVPPENFTLQDVGFYHTAVTDEYAHAWVEIFVENYGWTPIEVTPPGVEATQLYAGYGGEDDLSRTDGVEDNIGILSLQNGGGSMPEKKMSAIPLGDTHRAVLLTIAIYSICLLPLFLYTNSLRRRQALLSMPVQGIYAEYIGMLHFSGYPKSLDGTEADFSGWVCRLTSIPPRDTKKMLEIVSRAAFGQHSPCEADRLYVLHIYRCAAEEIYKNLNRRKKLIFRLKW